MSRPETPSLLTLIYGDKISLQPKKRVIDKELFSTLINGKELIERIEQDSKQYRIDVSKECEEIKEKAYQKGFEEGFLRFAEQMRALEEEIKKVRTDMEKTIAPVALKAAKRIVGKEIELRPEAVSDIIASHLKAVAQHKKVTIWVNKQDFDVVDKKKDELKKHFEALEAFSLRPRDDITPGGCIIETEVGIINATIENQWAILERAFEKLWKKESESSH